MSVFFYFFLVSLAAAVTGEDQIRIEKTIKLRNQVPQKEPVVMPVLSLGTAGFNNTIVEQAITAAVGVGFKAIHVAYDYYNLDGVSAALKQLTTERSNLFITAMTSPCVHTAGNPKRNVTDLQACFDLTTSEVNATLLKLGINYVDLLLLHGPSEPFNFTQGCNAQVSSLNQAQWSSYQQFLYEGKARSIGVSNFCPSCLKGLKEPVPSVNQIQWHVGMGPDPEGLMSYCKEKNIVVQAYSPLAGGEVVTDQLCSTVGTRYNKSAAQVGLRWVVQHQSTAVVVKASNVEYLQEDIDVYNWNLKPSDIAILDRSNVPHGQNGGRPSWGCAQS
jgi:diketogulonate reductase-like aldo/keto reductase